MPLVGLTVGVCTVGIEALEVGIVVFGVGFVFDVVGDGFPLEVIITENKYKIMKFNILLSFNHIAFFS